MNHRRTSFASLAAVGGTVALLSYAAAQPPAGGGQLTITHPVSPGSGAAPTEPLVVHDPYSESAHFVVRHLQLEGQGPTIHVQSGSTIHAVLEVNEHCVSCPTPHNHILVGFQGQPMAAACAWSGLRESGGWRTERFSVIAPMRPGVYPLRVRGASTSRTACDDETLSYWTRDLPGGPGPEATIGVVVVESPRAATAGTPPTTAPPTTAPATTVPTTTPATSSGPATTTTTSVSPAGTQLTTTTSTTTVTSTTTTATAPATLGNASFEQPDVAHGQSVPMASILGWTRTIGGGVEVHDATHGEAAAGQQWLELDGVDSSGISAEVATSAGSSYLVTLAFAPRPGTGTIDNRLEIRWNGEVVATLAASGEGQSHVHWTRVAVRVRATTASGRIELRDAGASNGQGTYVDDVSIAPTN